MFFTYKKIISTSELKNWLDNERQRRYQSVPTQWRKWHWVRWRKRWCRSQRIIVRSHKKIKKWKSEYKKQRKAYIAQNQARLVKLGLIKTPNKKQCTISMSAEKRCNKFCSTNTAEMPRRKSPKNQAQLETCTINLSDDEVEANVVSRSPQQLQT